MLRLERLALYSAISVLSIVVFTEEPAAAQAPENAAFNVVTVRQLKLVDEQGRLLIQLMSNDAGHGTVALVNAAGKLHTQLTTDKHGAGIFSTRSKDGVRITSIGAGRDGGELLTFDMAGKLGTLQASLKAGGVVSCYTPATRRVCYLGASQQNGAGILQLSNPEGKPRAELACLPDGNGKMSLWNKDGNPLK